MLFWRDLCKVEFDFIKYWKVLLFVIVFFSMFRNVLLFNLNELNEL